MYHVYVLNLGLGKQPGRCCRFGLKYVQILSGYGLLDQIGFITGSADWYAKFCKFRWCWW
ncbi:hypothetical protein HanRHA438_Chr10g0467561 [Helianthus annuus]|nr:hypothetical protein HanRHA438_Chr10g0467561 [Helianthus annuus]